MNTTKKVKEKAKEKGKKMNIKELREKKNLRQIDIARKLEVSESTVCAWETERRKPSFKNIQKLRRIFK